MDPFWGRKSAKPLCFLVFSPSWPPQKGAISGSHFLAGLLFSGQAYQNGIGQKSSSSVSRKDCILGCRCGFLVFSEWEVKDQKTKNQKSQWFWRSFHSYYINISKNPGRASRARIWYSDFRARFARPYMTQKEYPFGDARSALWPCLFRGAVRRDHTPLATRRKWGALRRGRDFKFLPLAHQYHAMRFLSFLWRICSGKG